MAILITGGCGFLGSHLVDQMVAEGCSVLVFDRVYKNELWDEYGWSQNPMVSFMLGDIKDRDSVFEAVQQSDMWVNLAGLLGTAEMINNPIPAVEVNVLGALNVFDAARLYKKRGVQIDVGNYWMNNPYSITKSIASRFASMYNKEHDTDIRIVRGMNVFGERQKHRPIRKLFPNLVIPALLNKPITLYGTGDQIMDLIYVKDIADILSRALLLDDVPNDVSYEAGIGDNQTINQTAKLVLELTGSSSELVHKPMRSGEDKMSVVQITDQGWEDLKTHLGFTKQDLTPFSQAVQNSIQWYRDNLSRFPWDE
jgi:nucleoside-diphosphate-sugar epimerase